MRQIETSSSPVKNYIWHLMLTDIMG